MMGDLIDGKTWIITGGTSGIGFAVAKALLERKAIVYAVGIPEKGVQEAAAKLAGYERARCALVDVTSFEDVKGIVDRAVEENGRLDYMFNNAGIGGTVQFENATLEHWKMIVDINLWGVIHGVHAAFPVMMKQGFGHIVNTSSIAGIVPVPYQALYCATKFAVSGMTEALRYEHAHRGIDFSIVCPANVATPIFGDAEPPEDAISPAEAAGIILEGVENKEPVIVFPEVAAEMYRRYRCDRAAFDADMFEMADARRKAYETGGRYY